MNRHASKTASVTRLASIPAHVEICHDVYLATSSPRITVLLERLAHRCEIVEAETNVGPSTIAPAVSQSSERPPPATRRGLSSRRLCQVEGPLHARPIGRRLAER